MTAAVTLNPLTSNATRVERGRSIKYEWEVDQRDGKSILAVLSISHHKAGINYYTYERTDEDYFSVSLTAETSEQTPYGSTRSFMLFKGLGLKRIPAGNRFSAKKLREAAAYGYIAFRDAFEAGDERVLRYFDPTREEV